MPPGMFSIIKRSGTTRGHAAGCHTRSRYARGKIPCRQVFAPRPEHNLNQDCFTYSQAALGSEKIRTQMTKQFLFLALIGLTLCPTTSRSETDLQKVERLRKKFADQVQDFLDLGSAAPV